MDFSFEESYKNIRLKVYFSFLIISQKLSWNQRPLLFINIRLLKDIKKLAIDLDRFVNELLEEGIEYLLRKYGKMENN